MNKKIKEKIPFQEYRRLKDQEAKRKFRMTFYPWPVMTTLLLPAILLIFMLVYYFTSIRNMPE
jgi:hypothetical protein